jgi:hypothetical protein
MNEQVRSILAQETTKTSKIRQLFLLGVPPCGNRKSGDQRQLRFCSERPAPDE